MLLKEELPAFLHSGEKIIRYLVRRFTQGDHPFLGERDLAQDGFETLLQVWNKMYPEVNDLDDMLRIGRTAVYRRLRDRRKQSRTRGAGESVFVSLDTPIGEDLVLEDVLDSGIEDAYFPFKVHELLGKLTRIEHRVLDELICPGEQVSLQAQRIEAERRADLKPGKCGGMISTSGVRFKGRRQEEVIADALGVETQVVSQAVRHIRVEVRKVFDYSPNGPYREVGGTSETKRSKRRVTTEDVMPTSKGFVPDDDIAVGMGMVDPAAAEAAPKKKEKVAATPKAASKDNGKTAKKATAKPAPKVEAKKVEPKKAEPKKSEPKAAPVEKEKKDAPKAEKKRASGPQFANGTNVKYLGGSRCGKVKANAVGVIKAKYGNPDAPRYQVRFGEGEKAVTTVIAGKYFEKVK